MEVIMKVQLLFVFAALWAGVALGADLKELQRVQKYHADIQLNADTALETLTLIDDYNQDKKGEYIADLYVRVFYKSDYRHVAEDKIAGIKNHFTLMRMIDHLGTKIGRA